MATTQARRRRLSADERRAQLLDATKEIVAEEGFHSVSIEAVARRAGITRPVVYEHFGDLNGLLEALVERESERVLAELSEILPVSLTEGEPAQLLLLALRGYLEAVRANPTSWRLVLMPAEGAPTVLRERIAAGRAAVIAALAAAIGTGHEGESRSPDPELTARMLSAVADEGARLVLSDPQTYPVGRLLDHAAWVLTEVGR
jgi:AcrR family transcriptional regulator